MEAFFNCHPAVNFLYFLFVLIFAMTLLNPICLLISVLGVVICCWLQMGGRELLKKLRWMIPVALTAAVFNSLFVHKGVTVLAYFPTGNALTLESIIYGLAAGGMLAATLLWFTLFSEAMTSDKFIYLFGRIIPALSLVLSMTLRLVPRFREQYRLTAAAHSHMGWEGEKKTVLQRAKAAVRCFSAVVTWSLENAVETADSMRSRGYGQPGRTAFAIFRMDDRDRLLLVWIILGGLILAGGTLAGAFAFSYYPMIMMGERTGFTVFLYLFYAVYVLMPAVLGCTERLKFRG